MIIYGRHILFFLSCLATSLFTSAQLIGTKAFSIGPDDNSIKLLTLIKHSEGYLLIGTTSGLYRFNGSEFSAINFKYAAKDPAVTAVHEDGNGKVWIGMNNGEIGFIHQNKIQFLNAEEGHPKVAITSILHDADVIYFATAGEGIYYYKNNRFYNINADDGLSDNYVYEIRLAAEKQLIAATDRGINICKIENDKKFVKSYTSTNGLPDNIVRTVTQVNKNLMVTGMQDKGIGLFDVSKWMFQFLPDLQEWIYGQVNSILNINKRLWVATEDKGIISVENNVAYPFAFDNDHVYTKTNHLLPDNEGNVWFTSNDQLIKTSGSQLQNIIPSTSILFSHLHTILSDRKGNIWVNYDRGLKMFSKNDNRWNVKDFALPLIDPANDITSLYEDRFDNLWVGTMGNGIIVLNPQTGKSKVVKDDEHLINGSILSINGKDDQIWISSLAGAIVCRLTNDNADINNTYRFENFSAQSGIGSNYIYSIMVDSKNRVWFATDGKGLTLYENNEFKNFGAKHGIKSLVIYSLCEDHQGNIWFSSLNGGVYKFDGKSFTNLSIQHGLNDPTITALAVDQKGNVIAVSKNGINIIHPEKLTISYLDAAQGLTELNTDLNSVASSPYGLLFSTSSGIVNYSPLFISLQPKIVLESVQLFLNDIDITEKKKFSYDENNLSFNFIGISLSHPEKIRYQYQLEGFSNQWVSTKDNTVNFPKLPPGKYTFKVRVSLNDNFTNSEEASYQFIISKPFWLQWWFIVPALLLTVALFYWYIKARERQVQRWDRLEKERIQSQFETLKSQVNPHFLFNSFNTLISVIEENPDNAVEYVEHLSDLYRKIVTYRDKDLISLHEEIELIEDYFFIQKKRFRNNLQLNIKLTEQQKTTYSIAPLTLQLLAENAVKHNAISSETPLTIEILIINQTLVVRNNINPKMTSEKGAGMGLQNIQNRYRLLNTDEVRIEKSEDTFVVYIPLIKEK